MLDVLDAASSGEGSAVMLGQVFETSVPTGRDLADERELEPDRIRARPLLGPIGRSHHVVRISKVYEAVSALVQRRRRRPMFHSALVATTPGGRFVIEMAEIRDARGAEPGMVADGAVGTRWLGLFRLIRCEIRRWERGVIPDLSYAGQSPVRITDDSGIIPDVLGLVPFVPTAVWGRHERLLRNDVASPPVTERQLHL